MTKEGTVHHATFYDALGAGTAIRGEQTPADTAGGHIARRLIHFNATTTTEAQCLQ